MMEWSTKERNIIETSETSREAIERYFESFPRSKRSKSSIYTYWWWREQIKNKNKVVKSIKTIANKSVDLVKKAAIEIVSKEIEASVIPDFEPGDHVQYARGSVTLSPVAIVLDVTKKQGVPARSQKIKVRFANYNVREVYACDYKIVQKGRK